MKKNLFNLSAVCASQYLQTTLTTTEMNLHMLIVDFDMLLRTGVALELVTTCQMTHHAF